jgi:hypothetical protein
LLSLGETWLKLNQVGDALNSCHAADRSFRLLPLVVPLNPAIARNPPGREWIGEDQ